MALPQIDSQPRELSDACRSAVKKAIGFELDGTQATLPLLDHYARSLPVGAEREVLDLLAPLCGAYFGEVLRSHFPEGQWRRLESNHAAWQLRFTASTLVVHPMGVALEVLRQSDKTPWPSELLVTAARRERLAAVIADLGQVPEERYYTFTQRFEVIEEALSKL